MPFSSIDDVLADLRAGKMIVLTDDENRENEGDLVLPAQFVTPEAVTFMLGKAMGYMCLSLTEEDCDRLNLHPQGSVNTSVRGTAFTVSIDLHPRFGGTTGVSAKERAKCIQMAIDKNLTEADFVRPGHINPLRSRDGGVLVRTGQTEGSVDLCRLAGLYPAAAIIEIMKPDGEMARVPDLEKFCAEHNIKMCSVAQIIEYRLQRQSLVKRIGPDEGTPITTKFGPFTILLYESVVDPLPHLVLLPSHSVTSSLRHSVTPTLVRMHRRNLLGDVFGDLASSPEGPSSDTLHAAMRMIQAEGRGALVYLRTTGHRSDDKAITAVTDLEGTLQTLRAKSLDINTPDLSGMADAVSSRMPLRDFGVGCQILRDLGLTKLRLLTNSTRPMPGIEAFGLDIVERVACR
ncbi:riboflavin biosynthesis protein RibBA [Phycisphaerae bacterium]|jgi:3,4-dihydroxy 2-butanone 4-phosphate synthase/GTP cyclohydrolase II|nr:riboflavin biosynthesis protein RibBA [Phycisphaerae bacterium]